MSGQNMTKDGRKKMTVYLHPEKIKKFKMLALKSNKSLSRYIEKILDDEMRNEDV